MSLHCIAVAGLKTVEHVVQVHGIQFQKDASALSVAEQLLATNTPGAPVVDFKGHCIGFISEEDILNALESERELGQLRAEEIMVSGSITVPATETIAEAVRIMKRNHILVLPVEKDGVVIGCVSRSMLLRAWLKGGLGQEV